MAVHPLKSRSEFAGVFITYHSGDVFDAKIIIPQLSHGILHSIHAHILGDGHPVPQLKATLQLAEVHLNPYSQLGGRRRGQKITVQLFLDFNNKFPVMIR